jgi:hypothetical protein
VPASAADEIDARVRLEINELAEKVLQAPDADGAAAWTDLWSDGGTRWRN